MSVLCAIVPSKEENFLSHQVRIVINYYYYYYFLTSSVNFIIDTYTCDVIFSGLSYMHVATYLLSTFGTSKSFFGVNPPRAILDSRPFCSASFIM